ncbi:MAG: EAL domain-containing protein, partial [Gammaproteobacteria bacterium]
MDKDLDIIPIHVIADSENKAEMLNGLLRAQGLAVKPVWSDSLDDWQGSPAELVFYFADTETPTLAEVVKHAEESAAPVIIIAREHDPKEAARALAAGAADWIRAEHDELLAAVARRERAKRHVAHRLRQFERDSERDGRRLKKLFSGSQDAIARLHDGIIVEANVACAELFGHAQPQALVGLPLMDLFAVASHAKLKQSLKTVNKQGAIEDAVNLIARRSDGSEREVKVEFSAPESDDKREAQIVIRGGATNASILRIEELETENEELKERAESLRQTETGSRLLWPTSFAPIAAERISRARAGSVRAVVAIRPAAPDDALKTFGALGLAEAGANLAAHVSPLLQADDLATRIADLSLLALINRPHEKTIKEWAETAVKTLGAHIFEGTGNSGHVEFVAGYVPVDRVRRLDALIRQALEAAGGKAGSVTRSKSVAETTAVETDDSGWAALIREALDEHRYTIALQPIMDLASGTKLYAALPRLLDRDGKEIQAASFYPSAARLGLLPVLEHRLAGHALLAQSRLPHDGNSPHVIVPLRVETMMDSAFDDFILNLMARVQTRPPPKSLVLELALDEIMGYVRDAEQFARTAEKLGCALGLRDYTPSVAADKLIALLPISCLRLAPNVMERIGEDEALAANIRSAAESMGERDIRVIATGVGDSNMMATLYNLGIGTVQGPVIGEAEF